MSISLTMVALNSRGHYENLWLLIFHTPKPVVIICSLLNAMNNQINNEYQIFQSTANLQIAFHLLRMC